VESGLSDKLNLDGLSNTEALNIIAMLVDQASDTDNVSLIDHVVDLADQLETRELQDDQLALLDYFRANAWACRYQRRYRDRERLWDFDQPEIQQQIFHLRRAAHGPGFKALDPLRKCQVLTSLGNQFDAVGRFVEARASWNAALEVDSQFWMAMANRGRGLMYYASRLYDPGHEGVFALHAHRDLASAVELISTHPHLGNPGLQDLFAQSAEQIGQYYDLETIGHSYRLDDWSLGNCAAEQAYRRWCLNHTLFLNPLNDVDQTSIASNDILTLPNFTLPIGEPPIATGMFNELKQMFASARWMLWEGIHAVDAHYSDQGVLLYDTLDYSSFGLSIEKVKMAFRLNYSIFDKIAYFLNFYLELGIPVQQVSFRTIWFEKKGGALRKTIDKSENWPLRGLYWLSKDLYEEGVKDTTEPEALALAELRNHMEHRYVKVNEKLMPVCSEHDRYHDTLAYYISRSDLEQKTLRIMQLVRSALIYLSLAMHHEERGRTKGIEELVAPMPLFVLPDDFKR
jgi:hypothetical protein